MWLEIKYINLLGSSLPLFKAKGNNIWNFRCPLCGDSKKSKHTARGYILSKGSKFSSYCHNCNASLPISQFIERINPPLYEQYIEEKFRESGTNQRAFKKERITMRKETKSVDMQKLNFLQRISLLDQNHPAKQFILDRKIPRFFHSKLYYAPNFNKIANEFVKDKYDPEFAEPRIVIPLIGRNKRLIGFQGRAIGDNKVKYITTIVAPDNPKAFGLDSVNFNRTYYVLEGPFDSMFIQNSIAACGGRLDSEIDKNDWPKQQAVIIYDNEPRNPDVVANITKAITNGYRVVIWPRHIQQKDINDMVLYGHSVEKIFVTIRQNTYHSIDATLALQEWKR